MRGNAGPGGVGIAAAAAADVLVRKAAYCTLATRARSLLVYTPNPRLSREAVTPTSDMTTIAESVSSPAPAAAISNKRPLETKADAANTGEQKTKQRSVLGGLQGKQVRASLRPAA